MAQLYLRHVVDHVGVADDVRVLSRPACRGISCGGAEPRARAPYNAAMPSRCSRSCARSRRTSEGHRCGRGLYRLRGVTSIATIGSTSRTRSRSSCACAGDAWEPGEWNLGNHYRWIGTVACLWVVFIAILFILPFTPTGVPWNDQLHVAVVQLRTGRRRDRCARRRLVDALGQQVVQGPDPQGTAGRARPRRGASSSRRRR